MSKNKLRALVGARTSVFTDTKVSHQAQLETASNWAKNNDAVIVGSFEDLGVSASVAPGARDSLGAWLTPEGAAQWDCIVWSKMDRAFRSTNHCVDFARWAEDNHKLVVFAEDGLTLDYRPGAAKGIDSMLAELFVYIGSFFAQMELNRFQTRAQDSHRVFRRTDRWVTGVPPLGFRVTDHPSGIGKGLTACPEGQQLLHQMASRLLDGSSFIRIADWLNQEGALTNMDRARVGNGKEPKLRPWSVTTVIDALTSQKTQGLKQHKGQLVLDAEGEPIRLADPVFDADTWTRIQQAAELRRMHQRTPTASVNPMLGIGVCGKCGSSLAQQISRNTTKDGVAHTHRYYRCGRTPVNCTGTSVRADIGDELLEQTFLEQFGDEPVTIDRFVPGSDASYELEQIHESIERLRRESDAGLIVSEQDEQMYHQRLKALINRRTVLESTPAVSAGWVTEQTGETYREVWDTADHRQLMLDKRIGFVLHQGSPLRTELTTP
jgi:site-specific DNA recombinase